VPQTVKVGAFDLAARRGEALGAACFAPLGCLVRVVVTPQPSTIACWRGPNDAIAATMSRSSRLYPLTAQIE